MANTSHKEVGKNKQRKHTLDIAKLWLGHKTTRSTMSKQAKVLNQIELRRVMDYIATRKHASRNRAMLMMTHLAGLRVGEVAALRYRDVVAGDGKVRDEIRLLAEQTKGSEARTVFINERLRKELEQYVAFFRLCKLQDTNVKFFYSQKRDSDGFTANTLAQFFHYLYKKSGIDGASSHSGRRSFASKLSEQGVGIRVLMNILGHKNITTTIKYVDANVNMMKRAVELA
jgi:integrase/recombinase XerD